jgi:hypothetical protein
MLHAFPDLQQTAGFFGVVLGHSRFLEVLNMEFSMITLNLIALNQWVTYGYYAMTLLFSAALGWNLWKSEDPQESILYAAVLIPFILRLLRLK